MENGATCRQDFYCNVYLLTGMVVDTNLGITTQKAVCPSVILECKNLSALVCIFK